MMRNKWKEIQTEINLIGIQLPYVPALCHIFVNLRK